MTEQASFSQQKRKLSWPLLTGLGLAHLAAFFILARVFAPDLTAKVIEEATSLVTVTVRTVEPEPEPEPDAGAAGDEGREATAREVVAPPNPPRDDPAPRAASTGNADQSGAREAGEGTGAGGPGDGPGSGGGGAGSGGGIAARPSVRSGEINDSRDFPIPEGGRSTRFGKAITVHFTVTVDGRARNCSVASSNVDAEATALACSLVVERIRFNPATTADGTPVEARYGYRISFRGR